MTDRDSSAAGSRPVTWRHGDRVLAPWEPMFLYAGTMDRIVDGRALIQFDDGDAGWVDLAYLQPLILKAGQRIMGRRRMGPTFFPGEIREVNGEQVAIEFDDGKEEVVSASSLRIPCEPVKRGAQPVKATSHRAFLEHLRVGSRVWALWNDAALFAGTIQQLHDTEAHIEFDDGDQAWVQLDHVLPLEYCVGMPILARRRITRQFAPATVSDTEGDRVQVRFEDGGEEWTTPAGLALPLQSPLFTATHPPAAPVPPAEPEVVRTGWRPVVVLAVGGILIVLVAVLFFLLGKN